jgi:hypothetical protein
MVAGGGVDVAGGGVDVAGGGVDVAGGGVDVSSVVLSVRTNMPANKSPTALHLLLQGLV